MAAAVDRSGRKDEKDGRRRTLARVSGARRRKGGREVLFLAREDSFRARCPKLAWQYIHVGVPETRPPKPGDGQSDASERHPLTPSGASVHPSIRPREARRRLPANRPTDCSTMEPNDSDDSFPGPTMPFGADDSLRGRRFPSGPTIPFGAVLSIHQDLPRIYGR